MNRREDAIVHTEVRMAHMRGFDDVGQRQCDPSKILDDSTVFERRRMAGGMLPLGFRLYSSDLPGGMLKYVHWLP